MEKNKYTCYAKKKDGNRCTVKITEKNIDNKIVFNNNVIYLCGRHKNIVPNKNNSYIEKKDILEQNKNVNFILPSNNSPKMKILHIQKIDETNIKHKKCDIIQKEKANFNGKNFEDIIENILKNTFGYKIYNYKKWIEVKCPEPAIIRQMRYKSIMNIDDRRMDFHIKFSKKDKEKNNCIKNINIELKYQNVDGSVTEKILYVLNNCKNGFGFKNTISLFVYSFPKKPSFEKIINYIKDKENHDFVNKIDKNNIYESLNVEEFKIYINEINNRIKATNNIDKDLINEINSLKISD